MVTNKRPTGDPRAILLLTSMRRQSIEIRSLNIIVSLCLTISQDDVALLPTWAGEDGGELSSKNQDLFPCTIFTI